MDVGGCVYVYTIAIECPRAMYYLGSLLAGFYGGECLNWTGRDGRCISRAGDMWMR